MQTHSKHSNPAGVAPGTLDTKEGNLDTRKGTLDTQEVARFTAIASEWWNPEGKFRPLHKIGPARLGFIRDRVCCHFDRDWQNAGALTDLTILDIGCGGGLIAEPLARLGGRVTGIDPSEETIWAAQAHAEAQDLAVAYRACRAEALAEAGESFDVVLTLEVIEHVPDVAAFLAVAGVLLRPGGLMVLSTLNRTLKAWALAIVGAEYVLRWLPVGTHRWEKFVTPEELARHLRAAGLDPLGFEGLIYNPLTDVWSLGNDLDVNYMAAAGRPGIR